MSHRQWQCCYWRRHRQPPGRHVAETPHSASCPVSRPSRPGACGWPTAGHNKH